MILDRERIDASIDADVANKELRALDKVRYLINRSAAEATCDGCHRRAPSPPSPRHLAFGSPIRKWPDLKSGCDLLENTTGGLIFMGTAICLFAYTEAPMTTLKIVNLHHDFGKKRSLVTVAWEDDPDKRLGLVVPFECPLQNLKTEAETSSGRSPGNLKPRL